MSNALQANVTGKILTNAKHVLIKATPTTFLLLCTTQKELLELGVLEGFLDPGKQQLRDVKNHMTTTGLMTVRDLVTDIN